MSLYALQKLIREINRNPGNRERFCEAPAALLAEHDLTDEEREALTARDYRRLYAMGVHGLLLRPFSILHQVSEPDYLEAIRGEPE
jgi:hypothetical protein